jgi:hypothetical protein
MTKLIVAFLNFANAPVNVDIELQIQIRAKAESIFATRSIASYSNCSSLLNSF